MPNYTAFCRCGRGWSGTVSAHCSTCHCHFSTVKNFDAHKPGRLRADGTTSCGDPAALTRTKKDGTVVPLLRSVERPHGIVWVGFSEDPRYTEDGDQ